MKKISFIAAVLVLLLSFSGCTRWVVKMSPPLLTNTMSSIFEECDPEIAQAAIPSNLKILEGLLKSDRVSDTPVKRPPALAFAVDETPPPFVLFTMAFQHIVILSSYLVLPVLVVTAAGRPSGVSSRIDVLGESTRPSSRWRPAGRRTCTPNLGQIPQVRRSRLSTT